jgi:pilus assembly protein CpaB
MKFALKLPSLNRNWLMLGGALLLGLAALGLSNKVISDKMAELDAKAKGSEQLVAVVVAKAALPRGAVIEKSMLAARRIPAQWVHSGTIDPGRIGQFLGQKLAAPVQPGEPLLEFQVEPPNTAFSATLVNGNRALTTEVDEVNSISGMLRPGDHIDLMATARSTGKGKSDVTFPLLSNVEVLATGQVTRKSDDGDGQRERTYTTITLSVSPHDAQRVVVAKSSGRLTAVLRNPEDVAPTPIPALTIEDVLPKQRGGGVAQHTTVQYIIGGKS